jgi:pyruvate dehydrogenase E2 component (dihydrolipoamide acetyltransferase)
VLADEAVSDAEIDAYVAEARTKQAEASNAPPPPEPAITPAAGWQVRALRMGEGTATPLLLIHGFGGDLLSWQMNQAEWAADRPVVAIDLPGHGGSSKTVPHPDLAGLAGMVAAAMDALELPRAHLAGHSLGGAIALQLALDHPDRVASVTLVCSAGLGPEVNGGYIGGFINADKRRELKSVVETLFADPSLVTREMVDDLLRYKRLDGVAEALRAIAGAAFDGDRQRMALRDRLGDLRAPVLAIWGAEDRIIPAAHAEAVERRHVIAGAGHMVHIEQAEAVNLLVRAFVAET